MEIKDELRYTKDHEWVGVDEEEAAVGITDFAQGELGDIVFLDLPEVGTDVIQGTSFGTIEAVKAATDLYAPVSGEIVAVNGLLEENPELINQSPYGDGWIIRVKMTDIAELSTLMDGQEYRRFVEK